MAIGEERLARIRLEAPSGKLEEDLRVAESKLRKFQSRSSRSKGGGRRREAEPRERLLRAARVGVGALEQAGSSLFNTFAGGVGDAVDVERALTRFQLAGDVSSESMVAFRAELAKVGVETGVTRSELLAGAASYLALTGDADGARNSVALFAKVANATGATMGDIADTAASMRENLKINPKDFEPAFSALVVQGKAGAIELSNLAKELSGVAPQFAAFKGGSGLEGLATMGAALQAGRKGFSSASEAATGFRALMVSLNRNATKFRGVKIFDTDAKTGRKSLRGFRQIIDDIENSRLAKDPTLLTKAFGSDEAKRFYDQLVLNRGLLDELEKKSANGGAVSADALRYQESAAGKLEQSIEKLKISIASAFTPQRIEQFAAAVSKVADAAARAAEAFNAVFEYTEVRDRKRRNEAALVKLGEYTGEDRQLLRESQINAKRIALEEERQRPILRAKRAERIFAEVGAGALQLQPAGVGQPTLPAGRSTSISEPRSTSSPPPVQAPSLPPISLVLDGEKIATSQKNARSSRRNLGGR